MTSGELAVVVTVASDFEAQTKAAVLAAEGIESTVIHNAPTWTGQMPISPTARGSSVLVHRDDLDRARAALERAAADSVDLNWSDVDVGDRDDDLSLKPVSHVPLLARIAVAVAWALIVLSILPALVMLILELLG